MVAHICTTLSWTKSYLCSFLWIVDSLLFFSSANALAAGLPATLLRDKSVTSVTTATWGTQIPPTTMGKSEGNTRAMVVVAPTLCIIDKKSHHPWNCSFIHINRFFPFQVPFMQGRPGLAIVNFPCCKRSNIFLLGPEGELREVGVAQDSFWCEKNR